MAGSQPQPYESALDAIPGSHPYPRSSRYHDAEIGIHTQPDGTPVRYVKRRLLPPISEADEDTATHTVSSGERPDHLGQRYFGDPAAWWRIADANPVLDPRELTAEPGEEIEIPNGFPGGGGGGGGGRHG
ncbi:MULTISPECIES: hypothetical protein [Streptomyces]|uniref:hypothetical protein n=1 Tax=Streptomyces TaxID=1883 RepID=UPI0015FB260D|nr:hypothetical protein [Streptomyces sp. GMR22]MBA6441688.1 hypothetical protein [Streptomyces sp. GMR22]